MKKVNYLMSIVVMCLLVACGGEEKKAVELSAEMQGFLSEVTNTKSMTEACAKYGHSKEELPLYMYDLEEPMVTNTTAEGENTCYEVSIKHGKVASKVNVCWKDKQIIAVTSIGFDHSR